MADKGAQYFTKNINGRLPLEALWQIFIDKREVTFYTKNSRGKQKHRASHTAENFVFDCHELKED